MRPVRLAVLAAATLAVLAGSHVLAQHQHHRPAPQATAETASTKAYRAAAHRMHQGMDITYTGDADRDFAIGMIPHHQGAIDMANVVLERGTRPELRAFAESIVASQGDEIALMRSWQEEWPDEASGMSGDHAMAGMDDMMMGGMSAEDLATADDVDLAFVEAMIPHHEGAVMMAGHVLSSTKRPEVRELAEAIIATQQAEIAKMRAWRDAWTG